MKFDADAMIRTSTTSSGRCRICRSTPRRRAHLRGRDPGQLAVRQGRRRLHHEGRPRPGAARRLQIEFSQAIQRITAGRAARCRLPRCGTPGTRTNGARHAAGRIRQKVDAAGDRRRHRHHATAVVQIDGVEQEIVGAGNGPLAAFCDALGAIGFDVNVLDYSGTRCRPARRRRPRPTSRRRSTAKNGLGRGHRHVDHHGIAARGGVRGEPRRPDVSVAQQDHRWPTASCSIRGRKDGTASQDMAPSSCSEGLDVNWGSTWDFLWRFLIIFAWIATCWCCSRSSSTCSGVTTTRGWTKALWVIGLIFIPWLTALVYVIARGGGMTLRAQRAAAEAKVEATTTSGRPPDTRQLSRSPTPRHCSTTGRSARPSSNR